MKQILFINHTFRAFDHLDSGASNRSYMFVSSLARIAHVDVISFVENEFSSIINCDVIYSKYIEHSKHEGRFEKALQLFSTNKPHRLYPLNKEKQRIIQKQLATKEYDYIAIRYLSEAIECGLLEYAERLILDVDDNPKDVMLIQAKNAKTLRNKLFMYAFANTMDKMVKYTLKNVFCCFHSNPLQPTIPNSIYLHNVTANNAEIPDINIETPMQILIVGLYHYGPNKQGVDYFLHNIFPIVREKNEEIILHIVGRIPNEKTQKEWSKIEGVEVMGYVPDLTEEYKNSRLAIVPIYSGSGTSVKVIEAMRMNRVCISTSQGMRGYDLLKSNVDYLLSDNDIQFAEHIIRMINDIDACNDMSHKASAMVSRYYSQQAYIDIVTSAITNKTSNE